MKKSVLELRLNSVHRKRMYFFGTLPNLNRLTAFNKSFGAKVYVIKYVSVSGSNFLYYC